VSSKKSRVDMSIVSFWGSRGAVVSYRRQIEEFGQLSLRGVLGVSSLGWSE